MQYLDGTVEAIPANVIAENLLSQVDADGHRHLMLDKIIDHRKLEDAIKKEDAHFWENWGFPNTAHCQ